MTKSLRVLIGCEESQEVTKAFRALGHEAYSCDLKPCSGGHPEWHLQEDVRVVLKHPHRYGNQPYYSVDGASWRWDIFIAFPECTHLAASGARHFPAKRADGRQRDAIKFFLQMYNAPVEKICVENPVGIMSGERKYLQEHFADLYGEAAVLPDPQIIQPWQFGHPESKKTCLWLKGLPPLVETNNVYDEMMKLPLSKRTRVHYMSPCPERSALRAKTYRGVAEAMATQFGGVVDE